MSKSCSFPKTALSRSVMLASVVVSGTLIAPNLASAQSGPAALEEVVVTATKRSTSVQDVPIAITVMTSETLENAGVNDILALERVAPSFNINTSDSATNGVVLRVRGVGTTGNNIGFESSVGVFVDGFYQPRPGGVLGDLVDIERIELLRGPQGTLFGRNTSAGALVIHTKRPDLERFGYFGNLTTGNYDLGAGQVGVNMPLIEDTLALKVTGSIQKRDGFIDGGFGGDNISRDRSSVRADMLWNAEEAGELRVTASYGEGDDKCCLAVWRNDSQFLLDNVLPYVDPELGLGENAGVPPDLVGRDALDDSKAVDDFYRNPSRGWGITVEYNVETPLGDLTYLGGYNEGFADSERADYTQNAIYSVGDTPAARALNPERDYKSMNGTETEAYSHEIRLNGLAFSDRLDWMVGAYYGYEELDQKYTLQFEEEMQIGWSIGAFAQPTWNELNFVSGGVDAVSDFGSPHASQESETWSIFTHNVFSVTDKLDVTLGLRYAEEEKDGSMQEQVDGQHNACFASFENLENSIPFYSVTPGLSLGRLGAAIATNCWVFTAPFYDPDDPDDFFVPYATNPATAWLVDFMPRPFDEKFEDEELTYTVNGTYHLNDNTNVYASFTHGFKSGGFNLDVSSGAGGDDPRFDSETVDAFEVGLKTDFWESRARVNMAIFYQDFEDFQVLEYDGTRFQTFNVPKAESQGVEVESTVQFTESFGMNLGITYTDAEYPSDCSTFNPNASDFSSQILPLCGAPLTNSSEWVGVLSANYYQPVFNGNWAFFAYGSARYESERRTSTQPTERPNVAGLTTEAEVRAAVDAAVPLPGDIQDSNTKVDLRFGLTMLEHKVSIEVWGNNVFDERTKFNTFDIPFRGFTGERARGQFVQEPRTYGLTLRKDF